MLQFDVFKRAPECLKSFLELSRLNGPEPIEIKMLEDFLNSFSLIIRPVSALSDFLKYNRFDFINASGCNEYLAGTETPCLQYGINKVIIFLSWESCIHIRIVFNESLFSDEATFLVSTHAVIELSSHGLCLLFSCLASRVLVGLIGSLQLTPSDLTLTVLIK